MVIHSPPHLRKLKQFPSGQGAKTTSGVIQWDNEEQALIALALCNHHHLTAQSNSNNNGDNGRRQYMLKLSFANPLNGADLTSSTKEEEKKPLVDNGHVTAAATDSEAEVDPDAAEDVKYDDGVEDHESNGDGECVCMGWTFNRT